MKHHVEISGSDEHFLLKDVTGAKGSSTTLLEDATIGRLTVQVSGGSPARIQRSVNPAKKIKSREFGV